MATDPPDRWGQPNTSVSLDEGAPEAFLLRAPCWSEAGAGESADVMALGGPQLRKGGRGVTLLLVQ
jgi:hypothetical protein